jgi:hypothetical protein
MVQSTKIFDDTQMLFDGVSSGWFTVATHVSPEYADLGGADCDERDAGEVVIKISGMTSSGSATVAINLLDCDTAGGSYAAVTPVQVLVPATAYDDALWDDTIRMPIPKFGVRRYIKINVVVGTAALTAGTITAGVVK